jgi:hypothetical protein
MLNMHNTVSCLLENVITQVIEELPPFMETVGTLQCSKKPATGPHPMHSPVSVSLFKIRFNTPVILSSASPSHM